MTDEWKYDPDEMNTTSTGNTSGECEQTRIDKENFLYHPIRLLLEKEKGVRRNVYNVPTIYLVTDERWTGYSSYTITNQWDEVHIHCGEHDLHYDGMGDFLTALAKANENE